MTSNERWAYFTLQELCELEDRVQVCETFGQTTTALFENLTDEINRRIYSKFEVRHEPPEYSTSE